MISVDNIEVKYSGVILVLKGVSLQIPDGSIIALLGANGAGKTTVLRAISGMLKSQLGRVTVGTIEFDGIRIENRDPEHVARLGVSQVMEGRRTLAHLSVEENLRIAGYVRQSQGSSLKEDMDKVYNYFPVLKKYRHKTSGYISGGEQQMLVSGRALITHPKFILMDELSLGLAPLVVQELVEIIGRINKEEGTGILLVEQNAVVALSLAEYGYVMESGRIVLDGPSQKLKENEDIREFYLGLSQVGTTKSYKNLKHYARRKRWLS